MCGCVGMCVCWGGGGHGVGERTWWTAGTTRGGAGHLGPHAHGNAAGQAVDGRRPEGWGQQQPSDDPRNNQHNPQHANNWAPLTRKRHIPPHSAQPQHTNYWAPRTWKQHQQELRPQRPTERSDPTQHAKGRTGDCPGPRKGATTQRTVTQGDRRAFWMPFPRGRNSPPLALARGTSQQQQRDGMSHGGGENLAL